MVHKSELDYQVIKKLKTFPSSITVSFLAILRTHMLFRNFFGSFQSRCLWQLMPARNNLVVGSRIGVGKWMKHHICLSWYSILHSLGCLLAAKLQEQHKLSFQQRTIGSQSRPRKSPSQAGVIGREVVLYHVSFTSTPLALLVLSCRWLHDITWIPCQTQQAQRRIYNQRRRLFGLDCRHLSKTEAKIWCVPLLQKEMRGPQLNYGTGEKQWLRKTSEGFELYPIQVNPHNSVFHEVTIHFGQLACILKQANT